jgi:hypothetical protein
MPKEEHHGKSEFGPTNILPPIEFDFTSSEDTAYGKSELVTEVHVLPPLTVDLTPEVSRPALRLTLRLRPTATPAEIAYDLFRLYAALNEYELSLGGSGLKFDESHGGSPTADGRVMLTFVLLTPDNAVQRIGELVKRINENVRVMFPASGVIEACEASLVQAA